MSESPPLTEAQLSQTTEQLQDTWRPVNNWVLAHIDGQDVAKFLQGQVTCNLDLLGEQWAIWGAHCNVKGRALANFLLLQYDSEIFLLCPAGTFPDLQTSLKKYGLFNRIQITPCAGDLTARFGAPKTTGAPTEGTQEANQEDTPLGRFHASKEADGVQIALSPELAIRITALDTTTAPTKQPNTLSITEAKEGKLQPETLWELGLIHAHLGFITSQTANAFIPIELNMDLLGGIAFDKGCYLGQEIIARLHYRGKPKQRLYRLQLPQNCPTLPAGTTLFQAEASSPSGSIISAVQTSTGEGAALAVLRIATIDDATNVFDISAYKTGDQPKQTLGATCNIVVASATKVS